MKLTLIRIGLTALVASALAGCGGGSDGVSGPPGTPATVVTVPVTVPGIDASKLSATDWSNLTIDTTRSVVTAVSIASPPEVTFTLLDQNCNAITGLEKNFSQASTAVAGVPGGPLTPSLPPPQPASADATKAVRPIRISVSFIWFLAQK